MNKEENWSEYWANEGALGEVFVGKEGKKHPHLTEFWCKHFKTLQDKSKIVDLACGGGSIFADTQVINTHKKFKLSAVDVSAKALANLNERIPEVSTIESSVVEIPLESDSFDVVVSQFGIEYAGHSSFPEAVRLLTNGGKLIVICHVEDGFIDAKNKLELFGASLLKRTGFIDKAIAITKAAFAKNLEEFKSSNADFTKIEPEIAAYVRQYNQGIHTHCYAGFQQMFQRKEHYELSDILDWLNAMKTEMEKTIVRLSEIRKAAQSKQQISEIEKLLAESDLVDIDIELFKIPEQRLPLAWVITGRKSSNG